MFFLIVQIDILVRLCKREQLTYNNEIIIMHTFNTEIAWPKTAPAHTHTRSMRVVFYIFYVCTQLTRAAPNFRGGRARMPYSHTTAFIAQVSTSTVRATAPRSREVSAY